MFAQRAGKIANLVMQQDVKFAMTDSSIMLEFVIHALIPHFSILDFAPNAGQIVSHALTRPCVPNVMEITLWQVMDRACLIALKVSTGSAQTKQKLVCSV